MSAPYFAHVGIGFLTVATCYGSLCCFAVLVWRTFGQSYKATTSEYEGVTILKPLCGDEPSLYEDLRTFCLQDYPLFQIVFGLHDEADPAREVAERLKREFASLPIDIVVDPRLHGSNAKVSNLINMLPYAAYDLLAMVDSDAAVGPDYLRAVTSPFRDEGVGLVTCLYRSVPTADLWSRLGAMYVNDWYMPAVLLAWLFGHRKYVSGQTMGIRQRTLRAFGGLASIANHLADDYCIGEFVRHLGLRIVLSSYVVSAEYHEPSLGDVMRHEIRWMRTIRTLRPASFCGLFLTFSWPLAVVGLTLAVAERSGLRLAGGLFVLSAACRLLVHVAHRAADKSSLLGDLWLVPIRDLLTICVWLQAFSASRITWRGQEYDVGADGCMRKMT